MDIDGDLAEKPAEGARVASISFDEHADRLHTYCLSLLRDHDAARTATYRTFVQANAHQVRLREPAMLRPWLYGLARNACLRSPGFACRVRRRRTGLDVEDEFDSLERRLRRAELRSLGWCAVDGLEPRHREVLELSVRHRLDPTDISLVIGQSVIRTRSVLDAAWHELERGLIAEALADQRGQRCAGLAAALESWDGRMRAPVRERILRHADRCQPCAQLGAERTRTATVPGVLPLVPAPRAVRDRLAAEQRPGKANRRHEALARAAGPFDAAGFPVRRKPRRFRCPLGERRSWALVAVGMVAVAIAGLSFGQLHPRTITAGAASQNQNGGITGLRLLDGGPDQGDTSDPPSTTRGPRTPAPLGQGDVEARRSPALAGAGAWASAAPGIRSARTSVAAPRPAGALTRAAGEAPGGVAPTPAAGGGAHARRLAIAAQAVSRTTVRLTLTARGAEPVSWRVRLGAPYLRISCAAGVLAPGASVRLTLTVDRASTPEGDWSASVTFQPGGARLTLSGHTPPARHHRRGGDPGPHPRGTTRGRDE